MRKSAAVFLGILSLINVRVMIQAKQHASDVSYATVKAIVAGIGTTLTPKQYAGETKDRGFLDLDTCQFGEAHFAGKGFGSTRLDEYAEIANEALILEDNLRAFGYPARLWAPVIARYESAEVSIADRTSEGRFYEGTTSVRNKMTGRLLKDLNAYRKRHRGLMPVKSEGGCGGGGFSVKVATQPSGGRIMVVPTFFYELCRVQGINPDDPTRCSHWREVVDGNVAQVSGDYRYSVRWHDGTIRRGKLSFDESLGDKPLIIRKP